MSIATWRLIGRLAILTLVVLCVVPLPPSPADAWPWTDELEHAFAFLALAWWFAVVEPSAARLRTAALLLALGAGIELVQGFLPWRTAAPGDLAADCLGIALGIGLAALMPAGFPRLRPAE